MAEEKLVAVPDYVGKYKLNESYRPIAEALVEKFPELGHVRTSEILFLDNVEGKGKSKNKIKNAQIIAIPGKLSEALYQLTGRWFGYIMEFFKQNIEKKSPEQVTAIIYHELRHIGEDGNLVAHDIEDWAEMQAKLGPGWTSPEATIPDILDEGFDWDKIVAPNLFGQLKAVK